MLSRFTRVPVNQSEKYAIVFNSLREKKKKNRHILLYNNVVRIGGQVRRIIILYKHIYVYLYCEKM